MKSGIETVLRGIDLSLLLIQLKSHLPTYKYQSFGAKPQMSVWPHFVRNTHDANMLSGILSHTLKIYIPATVPVGNSTNLFNTDRI